MHRYIPTRDDIAFGLAHPGTLPAYLRRTKKLARLVACSYKQAQSYLSEPLQNGFYREIQATLRTFRGFPHGSVLSPLTAPILYGAVRAIRAGTIVETGVASGVSSAFMLKGLQAQEEGFLFSIDLPNQDPSALLPQGKELGWIIPSALRHRWNLVIGKSKDTLQPLLSTLKTIDLFFHDSEHTHENMLFEFRAVWPHLRQGGILLSHDILANNAFYEFCDEIRRTHVRWYGLGGVRK